MTTTILILLPMVGAAGLWLTPWRSPRTAGGFALLVALLELGFWVGTAFNFDFSQAGLQFDAETVGSTTWGSRTRSASSTTRSGSSG